MVKGSGNGDLDERHVGMIAGSALLELLEEELVAGNALHRHDQEALRVRGEQRDGTVNSMPRQAGFFLQVAEKLENLEVFFSSRMAAVAFTCNLQ